MFRLAEPGSANELQRVEGPGTLRQEAAFLCVGSSQGALSQMATKFQTGALDTFAHGPRTELRWT